MSVSAGSRLRPTPAPVADLFVGLKPALVGDVRIGFAGYDRRNPTTLDHLLHQARVAAHQVHA
jgi:hypothetical protein